MALILYVEDHPPAQFLMSAIIGELTAHELHVASSGTEAQQMARQLTPALYIVDMDLPDTDGIALAKTLREIHGAPVILVSAYAESIHESTQTAAFGDAIFAYLPKPLDPDHVATTAQHALSRPN